MARTKLRIGFVFDDSLDSVDGVSQYIRTLGVWLRSKGHEVSYLVGDTKMRQWHGSPVHSLSHNLKVRFNANRLSVPLLARKKRIRQALALADVDILHVQMPYAPMMAQRIIAQAPPKTAVVGTFHILPAGKAQAFGSKLLGLWQWRSLRRFDAVVSVSQAAADFAQKYFGIVSRVVPNAVHIQSFAVPKKRTSTKQAERQIVFLGRLVERKGAGQLIEAYAQLESSLQKTTKLIIAGDGPLRSALEQRVAQLGLENRIQFLGFIDEAEKPTLLSRADIACFPALYGESFGIVLIEAMAAGAGVVIGGNNPGYRSVLGEKPELLIDPRDTAHFASRLTKLLNDTDMRHALHVWQQQIVHRYDVDVVGAELVNVYEQALAKRRANLHTKR